MCTVSMIGEHYEDKFRERWPQQLPAYQPHFQPLGGQSWPPAVSRAEFDALKAEVAEMVALLRRAKAYDEKNGEPKCELASKIEVLRKVAELVGVDLAAATGIAP